MNSQKEISIGDVAVAFTMKRYSTLSVIDIAGYENDFFIEKSIFDAVHSP